MKKEDEEKEQMEDEGDGQTTRSREIYRSQELRYEIVPPYQSRPRNIHVEQSGALQFTKCLDRFVGVRVRSEKRLMNWINGGFVTYSTHPH